MTLRGNILLLALLALLATAGGSYVYYYSIGDSARRNLVEHEEERQRDFVWTLQYSLKQHQEEVSALGGISELRLALEAQTPQTLAAANGVLDHFKESLHTEVCYLIRGDGRTIASSNRAAADSFVGKNYAFRPYFKTAVAGRPSTYAALGVTSLKRGLYFGHPVRGPGGPILGVVVLKEDLDEIIEKLSALQKGPAFLVDPQGVVFASNRPEFLLGLLWEQPAEVEARIRESQQFGTRPLKWSGFRQLSGGRAADPAGRTFELRQKGLVGLDGWRLVYLLDPDSLKNDAGLRALGWVGAGLFLFCLGLMAVTAAIYFRAIKEVQLRQQVTQKLREATDQLQALVDASPLPIMLVGNDGRVQLWNLAAERVFGWSAGEVLGQPLPIIPQDREDEFREIRSQMLEGTAFTGFETRRMRKDGTPLEVEVSTAPIKDQAGKTIGTMALVEDISERKLAERERARSQTLQSIGILAGGIAHDFNNLLGAILAVVTLLKQVELPREKAIQSLDGAEAACKLARDLTARLITFAPGGAPFRRPMDLEGELRSAVEDTLRGSKIEASFDLPAEPLRALADEIQVRQIFQNLTKNAMEAMPGGGTLTFRGEHLQLERGNPMGLAGGSYVAISVADTGPGIPGETLSKVFDPYFSTKTSFSEKGLGLGLTVCHFVAQRHGGAIRVESEVGKGTVFTLYLPRAKDGAAP